MTMMISPARARTLVAEARAAVGAASGLEDALQRLASALASEFALWRVSVRTLLPGGDQFVVCGVWSAAETKLGAGTRMSALATSFAEVQRTGLPYVWRVERDSHLLDQIMRAEGIQAYVSIPLRRSGEIVGLLSLSSGSYGVFSQDDEAFYVDLGAALEETLLGLAGASGSL